MEQSNSYKLLNIFLIESHFKRGDSIDFSNAGFKSNIDINTDSQIHDAILTTVLKIEFHAGVDGNEQIMASIAMSGLFETPINYESTIEDFKKINAPAIIFPFVREHLATISMKAGITPILLPPVNFIKLADDTK